MNDILALMIRLEALKRTARTGWNMKFPPGHKTQSRTVPNAESVADHSWSLSMFAFVVGERLGLNVEKMVTMALVHDVAECVTTDIVTATLEPEEKARVEAEKRVLEDAAIREIFLPLGDFGQQCYALWLEFEEGVTPEAQILSQLDRLECSLQAKLYREQGHDLFPGEFLIFARKHITHPDLLAMLDNLHARP